MGRPSWATNEQLAFLKTFTAGLDAAKATCGLTAEYTRISALFMQQWPAKPSEKEQDATLNPEEIQALADNRRKSVSLLVMIFSGTCTDSSLPANSRVVQELL